mgnify:CR=1 FL=1
MARREDNNTVVVVKRKRRFHRESAPVKEDKADNLGQSQSQSIQNKTPVLEPELSRNNISHDIINKENVIHNLDLNKQNQPKKVQQQRAISKNKENAVIKDKFSKPEMVALATQNNSENYLEHITIVSDSKDKPHNTRPQSSLFLGKRKSFKKLEYF